MLSLKDFLTSRISSCVLPGNSSKVLKHFKLLVPVLTKAKLDFSYSQLLELCDQVNPICFHCFQIFNNLKTHANSLVITINYSIRKLIPINADNKHGITALYSEVLINKCLESLTPNSK